MKCFLGIILLSLGVVSVNGQYKKVSFFKKEGTMYSFALGSRLFGNGVSPAFGIKMAFGKEIKNTTIFYNIYVESLSSSKVKFKIKSLPTGNQTEDISGKASSSTAIGFSVGKYLFKGDKEAHKAMPFIQASFDFNQRSFKYDNLPTLGTFTPEPKESLSFGTALSIGLNYSFNPVVSLTPNVGYRYSFAGASSSPNGSKTFNITPSHLFFSLGLTYVLGDLVN